MAEFAQWIAVDRLDPLGEDRGDMRAGIVAATIANVHATKGGRVFTAKDFMPEFGRAVPQQTAEQMLAVKAKMRAFAQGRAKATVPRG